MLVIPLVFVLLFALLLLAVHLVALLAGDAGSAEPVLVILRFHLDSNTRPEEQK